MHIAWFEDHFCYYLWKPHGIASSWGQGPCFLDLFVDDSIQPIRVQNIMQSLKDIFGKEQEYGLLNRLDNDTAGLLYFAKSPAIAMDRKQLQKNEDIVKYYIADIRGDVCWTQKCIAYPIAHHPQAKDRMICLTTSHNNNILGQPCVTWVEKLYYDREKNHSTLLIYINKGVRHQIRCHLASIGCPIIGEKIYKKKKDTDYLHLWSIGAKISNISIV